MSIKSWLWNQTYQFLMKELTKAPHDNLCHFERLRQEVRPGDVLLIEGHSRISRIIKRITQSPWTHASLYLGRLHDIEDVNLREKICLSYPGQSEDQLIMESMAGRGNYIDNLVVYRNSHVRICRAAGISYQDVQKIIAYIANRLGCSYSMRHLFDLARFLLKSHFIPSRFQSSLFNQKSHPALQDICSALIAKAFILVKFPILPLVQKNQQHSLEFIHRNSRLFVPCDFDYSPYFEIIKYPLFPMVDPAPYRHLPWNEQWTSNDEAGVMKRKSATDTI